MASLLRIKNGDLVEVLNWEEVEGFWNGREWLNIEDYEGDKKEEESQPCIEFYEQGDYYLINIDNLEEEGYIYIEYYDVESIIPLGVNTQEVFDTKGYFKIDIGDGYKIIEILSENSYYFEEEQVVIEDLKGNNININLSNFSKYSILCYYHKKDEKYYVVEDYDGDDYLYDFIIKDCCRDQYGDLESIAYFENEIEKNKKIII